MSLINTSDVVDHLSTREAYDRWAQIYDVESNPLVMLEQPHVERLLGDVGELRVADLGCGTGRHSLRIHAAGANVTGLDFSDEMLNKARCKPGGQSITFIQHDLAQRLPLNDESFDRVLCSLVLDHVANLTLVFSEMKRICKPHPYGFVVISLMHPALMLRGVQARFTDPVSGREIRPQSCPHQISDYIMAISSAGLRIDQMSEHVADQSLADRCPRAEKYLGWPLLIMMKLLPI